MDIVGIHGNAGVGKDTFAEVFHHYGYRQYAFATPIKEMCKIAFGFTEGDYTNRDLKELKDHYWKYSPREVLQIVGTELFRATFGDDFWIRRLELQLLLDYKNPRDVKVIISDVRFQNEADWIVNAGGKIIHLTRPGYDGKVGITNHASEAGIDFTNEIKFKKGVNYYEIINDKSLTELRHQARQFCSKQ